MSQKTEIVTAISTLGCAIGIGFIMQSGEIADLRYGPGAQSGTTDATVVGEPATDPQTSDIIRAAKSQPLEVRGITLTSADIEKMPMPIDVLVRTAAAAIPEADPTTALSGSDAGVDAGNCAITARAEPSAAAMVNYRLDAPCLAASPVVISHNGMTFTDILSDHGQLDVLVPALSENARITAAFATGERAAAVIQMANVPLYDRIVVQWRGQSGVQIHAREDGARYGEDGHVWAGARRDVSAVVEGRGGFLTVLGNATLPDAQRAEIYTFPSALNNAVADVDLSVETEVTRENCGKEIKAHALQFKAGRKVSAQDLSLFVPECDAVGSFLVLNNLLQDLTVAGK